MINDPIGPKLLMVDAPVGLAPNSIPHDDPMASKHQQDFVTAFHLSSFPRLVKPGVKQFMITINHWFIWENTHPTGFQNMPKQGNGPTLGRTTCKKTDQVGVVRPLLIGRMRETKFSWEMFPSTDPVISMVLSVD